MDNPPKSSKYQIILSSNTENYRKIINASLVSESINPIVVPWLTKSVLDDVIADDIVSTIFILEMGNDIAGLCIVIYKIYELWEYNYHVRPIIIPIVDEDDYIRNPSIGHWDIQGLSAYVALIITKEPSVWVKDIVILSNRIISNLK